MIENLSEADIETKCIEPALTRAGWDVTSPLVHKQLPITKGRMLAADGEPFASKVG